MVPPFYRSWVESYVKEGPIFFDVFRCKYYFFSSAFLRLERHASALC